MRLPSLCFSSFVVSLCACLICGCGGGGSSSITPPPPAPTFTSVPPAAADEGADYTYQPTATSPDGSAITFSLRSSPTGATLSAGALSWTPAHNQSRVPNQFSVTATTAKGGSATQSWSVTPSGVVAVSDVVTYWTPSGPQNHTAVFGSNAPYPSALVSQSDGTLAQLRGTANADGTYSIPHVPAGYYWLAFSPIVAYWTSSSTFDAGSDIAGSPVTANTGGTSTSTTFNITLTGAQSLPVQSIFSVYSNAANLPFLVLLSGFPGSSTATITYSESTIADLSVINTLFFNQYVPIPSAAFNGLALAEAATESGVTITDGTTNTLSAVLQPSPTKSVELNIQGSAWASNFENIAPSAPTAFLTDFSLSVQPFVQSAATNPFFTPIGTNLTLFAPINSLAARGTGPGFANPISACALSSGPTLFPGFGSTSILTDQDLGLISYGDPYPDSWLREFQLCQFATVEIPRPDSSGSDVFLVGSGQITAPPSGPVAPLVGPVQSPTLNGASLFQSASLNTTTLNFSWTAPTNAAPTGYYLAIYRLQIGPSGQALYLPIGRVATSKTSTTLPFIAAGNTYVFVITSVINAGANIESAPNRAKLPLAFASVVSAAFTVNAGATATVAPSHN